MLPSFLRPFRQKGTPLSSDKSLKTQSILKLELILKRLQLH